MKRVNCECPFCGVVSVVECREAGLVLYQAGACIQDAFPDLSADDRELLKTGICPQCWNDTFGEYGDTDY